MEEGAPWWWSTFFFGGDHQRARPWRLTPTSSLPPLHRRLPVLDDHHSRRRRRRPEPDTYDADAVRFGYRSVPGRVPASPRPIKRPCVPAATKAVLGLREVTSSTAAADACSICLQDLFRAEAEEEDPAQLVESETTTTTKLRAMPCSHAFHQPCIFEWLRRNSACPLCRHQLPTEEEEEWEERQQRERRMRDLRRCVEHGGGESLLPGDGEESGEVWIDGPVICE